MTAINRRILFASIVTMMTAGIALAGGATHDSAGIEAGNEAPSLTSDSAVVDDTTREPASVNTEAAGPEEKAVDTAAPAPAVDTTVPAPAVAAPVAEPAREPASEPAMKKEEKQAQQPPAAQQGVIENKAVVLEFIKGNADLSAPHKDQLRALIDSAKGKGSIDKVNLAVWSDKAFPAAKDKDLSKADRELAQKRISNIQSFLKDQLQISDVETFNMAERTNFMARAFSTDEAELKSMFGRQGATPITNEDFNLIKQQGAPSRAVVLVTWDTEQQPTEAPTTGTETPQ